jgi:putative membrane protein
MESNKELPYRNLIIIVSIVVPILVTVLFFTKKIDGYDFSYLPTIYATINGVTAFTLIAAFIAIKNKNILLHKTLMTACIAMSVMFLLLYVVYHSTAEATSYGGVGISRSIYFFILISHILLSIVTIPLVLITYVRALSKKFDKHKKIARITFPIWLYVAITGVIVYVMISPYYN